MEINDKDWELINDDGFIYWRPKRPRLDSTTTTITATTTVAVTDPAAEAKSRRERKKKVLLNLKKKYQQEINHWEHLSNTLQALQQHTQSQSQNQLPPEELVSDQTVSGVPESSLDSSYMELVDTLLAQVCEHCLIVSVFC